PWIAASCPDAAPDAFTFDLDCRLSRCPRRAVASEHCRYRFTLDCDFGELDGTLEPDGSLCLEPSSEALTCEARATDAHAIATYQCTAPRSCRIDAYRAPQGAFFDEAEFRIFDAPLYIPSIDLTGPTREIPRQGRFIGYAYDFAIAGGSVVVSKGP